MYDKYVNDIISLYEKEQNEYEELEKMKLNHEEEHKEEDRIHDKYDKLILSVNEKYNIIFRYDLLDSYGTQISTLVITSDEENNVWCVYDNEGYDKELKNKSYTIDSDIIKTLISGYEDKIKDIKEIESPSVLDGVISCFYFNINGNNYERAASNLWAWEEDIPGDVALYLNIFEDIKESLKNNVDDINRCLTLGD